NASLKRRAWELKRHGELSPLAGEVFSELFADCGKRLTRELPRGIRSMPTLVLRDKQTGQELSIPADDDLAQRGIDVAVDRIGGHFRYSFEVLDVQLDGLRKFSHRCMAA